MFLERLVSSTVGGQASPRNSGKSVEWRHALRNVWRRTHCGTHSAWGGATEWIFSAGAIFAAADRRPAALLPDDQAVDRHGPALQRQRQPAADALAGVLRSIRARPSVLDCRICVVAAKASRARLAMRLPGKAGVSKAVWSSLNLSLCRQRALDQTNDVAVDDVGTMRCPKLGKGPGQNAPRRQGSKEGPGMLYGSYALKQR